MENLSKCIGPAFEFVNMTGLPATIAHEANSFFCLEKNWCALEEAIERLKVVNKSVNIKVTNETNKLKECEPDVVFWLTLVDNEIQTNTLKEEYNKLEKCGLVCSCAPNLPQQYHVGKQIVEKLALIKNLIEDGKKFTSYGYTPPPDPVDPKPQTNTIGLEPMLNLLLEYFNDNNRNIIGIWGQGGVGKTTLLNAFNNYLKDLSKNNPKDQRSVFPVVIAIDVSNSETLDVASIQSTITERLGYPWNDTDTEAARAKILIKALSKKRFVILLDDVWKKFCLEDVGIPTPSTDNGCKIVLASRDANVCIGMNAHHNLIGMQLLDEAASWELFRSNLSPHTQVSVCEDVSIERQARAISKKCGGLPLALNVIGKTVASCETVRDWEDAERAISFNMAEMKGVEDEMYPRLRFSYDKLDVTVKQCFLYCTLFPENSSIKKDQLVEYWMAEGFLSPNQTWKGSMIIKELLSVCLLQSTSSDLKVVRLHNVIRDFGLWLANKENTLTQVWSGQNAENPPEVELWQDLKKISLMSNDITDISISPYCSNLETLLLQRNRNLKNLPPNFFESMSNLKVLDLSNTDITELPECDALVQLQYLNLSETPIKTLPERLFLLQQLRHLDLSVTKNLEKTFDNCSKLLKLRVLNLFRSHYGIRDVSDLNIDTLKELYFLGIAIHAEDVLKKLKKTDPLVKSTHRLSLKYCNGMKSIHLADFNKMLILEELYIELCNDLSELEVDKDENRESHLQELTLRKLPKLRTIVVRAVPHYLMRIHELTIHKCHMLNHISWVANLESLEKLAITCCSGIIQIVEETQRGTQGDPGPSNRSEIENAGNNAFPKLRSIVLSELQQLVSICNARDFPCLESISIQDCPKLKKLPIARDSKITKLRQICGSLDWWQDLRWDDKELGESFEDFFIPYGSNGGN